VIDRQVQSHQDRHAVRRQVLGKIVTMKVDDVDRPFAQGLINPQPMQF
jgi:hypothetical protein